MSRIDQIEQLLKRFVALTPDLEGAILVTLDGLPIASALSGGTDEDRVAAMGAAALATGSRTVSELSRGELEQVLVKGSEGYIVHIATPPTFCPVVKIFASQVPAYSNSPVFGICANKVRSPVKNR